MISRTALKRGWGRYTYFLIAVVLIVGAGCASGGSAQVKKALSPGMKNARTVVVRVTSTVPNSEETTRELEGAIVEHLRSKNVFERVRSSLSVDERPADVTVLATIVQFRGVSELARGLAGGFAGQSLIVAEVSVRDGKSAEVLGEATVEGTSSAGSVYAGTTMQAIQRTAEQVAGFMVAK